MRRNFSPYWNTKKSSFFWMQKEHLFRPQHMVYTSTLIKSIHNMCLKIILKYIYPSIQNIAGVYKIVPEILGRITTATNNWGDKITTRYLWNSNNILSKRKDDENEVVYPPSPCSFRLIYHTYVLYHKFLFYPLIYVPIENGYRKWIVHPLKHMSSYLHIFVSRSLVL